MDPTVPGRQRKSQLMPYNLAEIGRDFMFNQNKSSLNDIQLISYQDKSYEWLPMFLTMKTGSPTHHFVIHIHDSNNINYCCLVHIEQRNETFIQRWNFKGENNGLNKAVSLDACNAF